MKSILLVIMLLLNMNLFCQINNYSDIPDDVLEHLDKMGVDGLPLLNCYESTYFNVIYKDSLNGFDLTNKRIGFLHILNWSSKEKYFEETRERFHHKDIVINGKLYIFDESQKIESGGYDGAIVYWSKRLIPADDVVKRLKKRIGL